MEIKLIKTESEIKRDFPLMKDRLDICNFLEIDEKTLLYLLYRNKAKRYKEFKIPKKSGEFRTIKAPNSSLKILQKKLSNSLYIFTKNHKSAHGFVSKRDIKTNAKIHVKRNFVLNLDLENFFDSINFGRVMGLFMSNPFNFNKTVAVILAQICCDDNSLPQGAPTSPILSNLICYRLDNLLFNFAQENYCNYTRYADDITFSFFRGRALKNLTESESDKILSERLQSIITSNGFKINFKKVSLSGRFKNRQKVTGLLVTNKVNIERKYIKNIRSILYSWETKGIEGASKLFFTKHPVVSFGNANEEKFLRIVKGKLNFIKQIRGYNDFTWRKLENKYNYLLNGKDALLLPLSHKESIEKASWVIESGDSQGSGFFAKDNNKNIYFITCAHVLTEEESVVYRPGILGIYNLKIIKKDDHRDIALCEITDINKNDVWCLDIKNNYLTSNGQKIKITGYPNYGPGQKIRIEDSLVTGEGVNSGVDLIRTNGTIISGNSGGAIIDTDNEVIGIASNSKTCILGESAFLPISTIYLI